MVNYLEAVQKPTPLKIWCLMKLKKTVFILNMDTVTTNSGEVNMNCGIVLRDLLSALLVCLEQFSEVNPE
ncbi:Hypothetical predicted protein [Octopus vulgaris]|uniref:Uncharacterized protein n=1 Tax=Octopus vulgaris TaxID=6645 RepID=A0AA36F9M5_OCTVU|nr:Hypothetical predicted protein [Octopus vulgaris]